MLYYTNSIHFLCVTCRNYFPLLNKFVVIPKQG